MEGGSSKEDEGERIQKKNTLRYRSFFSSRPPFTVQLMVPSLTTMAGEQLCCWRVGLICSILPTMRNSVKTRSSGLRLEQERLQTARNARNCEHRSTLVSAKHDAAAQPGPLPLPLCEAHEHGVVGWLLVVVAFLALL